MRFRNLNGQEVREVLSFLEVNRRGAQDARVGNALPPRVPATALAPGARLAGWLQPAAW